jgi:hypothetical protein
LKITLSKNATCGKVPIPAGEYWVTLQSDTQQIILMARGSDIKIPATRRRTASKGKSTTVSFYAGGGPVWSLVVCVPKFGEWVSFIELLSDGKEEKK